MAMPLRPVGGFLRWLAPCATLLALGCATPHAPGRAGAAPVARSAAAAPMPRLLVFTRTTGYRHDSIATAVATLRALAATEGFALDHGEDASVFEDARLRQYRAVVFANTTGNVLDGAQRAALERFVCSGGGFLGLHSAADSEYDSPLHAALLVARFASHPPGLQRARVRFEPGSHGAAAWWVTDEFYDFDRNPRGDATIIATVVEADYAGGRMGGDHPVAWCHARLGGRSWYTGLGHDIALYADPVFRQHVARGLRHVTGRSADC